MSPFAALGEFEHVVLVAVLQLARNASAVSVRDEIEARTGRRVSRGAVYVTLDRLETKGYLTSTLGDPTAVRGGRARRYYTLRPRGVAALRESRRALLQMWRGADDLLEQTR